jgi:hypothetical protein
MFGDALVTGIVLGLTAVVALVVVGVLVFARRGSSGRPPGEQVPPPVDPGPAKPEQARDINAERDAAKEARRDARNENS